MVSYSQDKKYAYFGGLRFCRDDKTGYYLNSVTHKRLHRFVYESIHGEIPSGMQVHHIDHDKGNNEPENLEMLTARQHCKRHADEMSDSLRQFLRENMASKAAPAAAKWHGSEQGKEWHKKHYEETGAALHATIKRVCKQCGSEFDGILSDRNVFCSNACAAAWRRRSGVDNEQRICAFCGKKFTVNKYAKTKCCSRSCADRLRHQSIL